jgi:copper(I)-binding protein
VPAALACDGLVVESPWIREAPPGARAMVGFAKLHNSGDRELLIESAASADFGHAELHESMLVDGQARMRAVGPLKIAAGETVALAPGGYHLMLMQPQRALTTGDSSRIDWQCASGSTTVTFPVLKTAP